MKKKLKKLVKWNASLKKIIRMSKILDIFWIVHITVNLNRNNNDKLGKVFFFTTIKCLNENSTHLLMRQGVLK